MTSTVQSPRLDGEFELIRRLKSVIATDLEHNSRLIVGIGDDAAAFDTGHETILLTTDTLVSGIHFRTVDIGWKDLGWKSMAVNLSDIAAMGGKPSWALVTLGLPAETNPEHVDDLYRGMQDILGIYGGTIIGGDTVRSASLFISVTLAGTAVVTTAGAAESRGKHLSGSMTGTSAGAAGLIGSTSDRHALLRRASAVPGDLIAVTGALGGSSAGLRAINEHRQDPWAKAAIKAHLRPQPRIKQGQIIVSNGACSAMDLSDGLVSDLGKLTLASGVVAIIRAPSIPIHDAAAACYPEDALTLALTGGEDYELVFTAPSNVVHAITSVLDIACTVIGEVHAVGDRKSGTVKVLDARGLELTLSHGGWDHFRD